MLKLRHGDFGFKTSHILVSDVLVTRANYEQRDIVTSLYQPLLERVRAVPGVESAGLIQAVPFGPGSWRGDMHVTGTPPNPPSESNIAKMRVVTPGYYDVFQQQVVQGRLPDPRDTYKAERVAVVNQAFVRRFFPRGGDPLTAHLDGDDVTPAVRIIGVVRDLRQDAFDAADPEVDYPVAQIPPEARLAELSMIL